MATSQDYIAFVCEQIEGNWSVRYRKMFGEYMIYINEKPILLVCDDTVFVKQLGAIRDIMEHAEKGYPYQGAKEHYILDIEDRTLTQAVIEILEPITALPKPRKPKAA